MIKSRVDLKGLLARNPEGNFRALGVGASEIRLRFGGLFYDHANISDPYIRVV